MKQFTTQSMRRMRGITLIELMIVVAVVGILAGLAYPAYLDQVRKTKRADGKEMLLRTSQLLERCYTRTSSYAGCVAFPQASDEGHYSITAAAAPGAAYDLIATPQGDQTADTRCGALRLTSIGQQGSQGLSTDANNCW